MKPRMTEGREFTERAKCLSDVSRKSSIRTNEKDLFNFVALVSVAYLSRLITIQNMEALYLKGKEV